MSEEIINEEQEVYIEHMCAKHVLHPEFGEGFVLEGQHDVPDQDGYISWYSVQFDHGVETIQTEDVKIMHESHHGHMMKKKKKKMDEGDQAEKVSESTYIQSMVDDIVDGSSSAAKEQFENALAMKITAALDSHKQKIGASLYNEDNHEMGHNVKSKKRMAQAKKNIKDVDKVDDLSGVEE